jgi:AcrR family transcriptional regulator
LPSDRDGLEVARVVLADQVDAIAGVLRFLFGSRDGLVAAVLQRAREDELRMLARLPADGDLHAVSTAVWTWLADPAHAALLRLWTETYSTSLKAADGPWAGHAARTVTDRPAVLARSQPASVRNTAAGRAQRTATLAVLRGGMLDLLATVDRARTTRAVRAALTVIASST